jgi:hypothetical protein
MTPFYNKLDVGLEVQGKQTLFSLRWTPCEYGDARLQNITRTGEDCRGLEAGFEPCPVGMAVHYLATTSLFRLCCSRPFKGLQ